MKLLLDAHFSGRANGTALTARGHDVLALDANNLSQALRDPEVLALATSEGRVLVTANVKDFVPLAHRWQRAGCSHAGLILVPSRVINEDFGLLITGIDTILGATPQDAWIASPGSSLANPALRTISRAPFSTRVRPSPFTTVSTCTHPGTPIAIAG